MRLQGSDKGIMHGECSNRDGSEGIDVEFVIIASILAQLEPCKKFAERGIVGYNFGNVVDLEGNSQMIHCKNDIIRGHSMRK